MISEHIMQSHSGLPATTNSSSGSGSGSYSYSYSGNSQKRTRGAWEAEEDTFVAAENLTLQQRLRRRIQEARQAMQRSSQQSHFQQQQQQRGAGLTDASGVVRVELMRRYIEYAKQYVHPHLSPAAAKVLQRLYLTMRSEASAGQSIPVTTRHLESLIRLSQARARVELREEVTPLF